MYFLSEIRQSGKSVEFESECLKEAVAVATASFFYEIPFFAQQKAGLRDSQAPLPTLIHGGTASLFFLLKPTAAEPPFLPADPKSSYNKSVPLALVPQYLPGNKSSEACPFVPQGLPEPKM